MAVSPQQSSSAMESWPHWPHWADMDHAGGRASSWLDHGPDVFLTLPRLAGGHQAAAITQPLFFYLKVNLMTAFVKLFTALNVEVISTYFFLIQHSEHIGVLLQLFPCPKVKKKVQHLLLGCFCNQTYQRPQKTQTSPICTLLQLRKREPYKTQKRLKTKGLAKYRSAAVHKAVWRRSQVGTIDSKNKLRLDTEPGRLPQSLSSSCGPPVCSPGTVPFSI